MIHQLGSTANSAQIKVNQAELAVLPRWWISGRYLWDSKSYIFEIRTLQGLKWSVACLRSSKNNPSDSIMWVVSNSISQNSSQLSHMINFSKQRKRFLVIFFMFIFICLYFFILAPTDECTADADCTTEGKEKCDEAQSPKKCVGKWFDSWFSLSLGFKFHYIINNFHSRMCWNCWLYRWKRV